MSINYGGDVSYAQEMRRIFSSIEANPVGQVIVLGIRLTGKDLVFEPYNDNDCNAITHPLDARASAPKGLGYKAVGAPVFQGIEDNPLTPDDERRTPAPLADYATGEGSDVRINYSPGTYAVAPHSCYDGTYGTKADESLLHEMVHALRKMQGLANPIPTDDNSFVGYHNDEEFLAIVATNVYISPKGGTQFRANHHGHTPLDASLSTSEGFLANDMNRQLLNIYRLTWMGTFLGLASVRTAKFNPFRALSIQLGDFPADSDWEPNVFESARQFPRTFYTPYK